MTSVSWHFHRAFGLNIRSCLPLPPLLAGDAHGPVDVEIVRGVVPVSLSGAAVRGPGVEMAPGRLLLRIDGRVGFLVTDGARVVVAAVPGAADHEVRGLVLAPVFGALLHQRGEVVLHGSAIVRDGAAVAFLGPSGVGKSTLAAAFRRKGCAVLTDDQCLVRPGRDGGVRVEPGYPLMKLTLDALGHLAVPPRDAHALPAETQKKGLRLAEDFARAAAPLRRVYVLFPHDDAGLRIEPVAGQRAFQVLQSHTYRLGFRATASDPTAHFARTLELARHVPVALVRRPRNPMLLDELVAAIERDLDA